MKEHGIFTLEADFWAHVFPLERAVFWYRSNHCRQWIQRGHDSTKDKSGRSKDGSVTGRGVLISQNAPFVRRVAVPTNMVACFDWTGLSDREVSRQGEQIFAWMVDTGLLVFPPWSANQIANKKAQFEFGDFVLAFRPRPYVEVKTEMKVGTGNLYVQTHESGHKPTLVQTERGIIERHTEIDGSALDGLRSHFGQQ